MNQKCSGEQSGNFRVQDLFSSITFWKALRHVRTDLVIKKSNLCGLSHNSYSISTYQACYFFICTVHYILLFLVLQYSCKYLNVLLCLVDYVLPLSCSSFIADVNVMLMRIVQENKSNQYNWYSQSSNSEQKYRDMIFTFIFIRLSRFQISTKSDISKLYNCTRKHGTTYGYKYTKVKLSFLFIPQVHVY